MRRDLNGGPEQEVCRVNAKLINSFAVSRDGGRLGLIAVTGDQIRIIMTGSATGGEFKEILRSKDFPRNPVWSQDGRHLIWKTRLPQERSRNEIVSISVDGGEPHPFGMALSTAQFLSLIPDDRRLVFLDQYIQTELWVMKLLPPNAKEPR